jgi:transcriptional regulator with XRE-family HTH domain
MEISKMRTALGAKIKAAREAKELSLSQVANIIGCTKNTISQLEHGREGGLPLLEKLMELYGIEWNDVIFKAKETVEARSFVHRKKVDEH